MKKRIALLACGFMLVGCSTQNMSFRSYASIEDEAIVDMVSSHYQDLGYSVTAVSKLQLKNKDPHYHVTLTNGNDGCSQVISLKSQDEEVQVEYLGEIDCR